MLRKQRYLFKTQYMGGGWYLLSHWHRFITFFSDKYWKREIKKGHFKYSTQYMNDPCLVIKEAKEKIDKEITYKMQQRFWN